MRREHNMSTTPNRKIENVRLRTIGLLLIAATLFGCSAPKPEPVFFPPKPDLPRVQFLMSIRGTEDLKSGAFAKVLSEGSFKFSKAFGVAFYDGKLYVTDSRQQGYAEIDFAQESLKFITSDPEAPNSLLPQPLNIVIAPDGTKFIVEKNSARITEFSADNHYLRSFSLGEGSAPAGITVDDKYLYVGDLTSNRIYTLDRTNGNVVRIIEKDQGIAWPLSLALSKDKTLYVVNTIGFNILKFAPDGTFIKNVGAVGDTAGTFARPKGIAVAKDGTLFAVDSAFQNIQVFNTKDQMLMYFPNSGSSGPARLSLPAAIAISYDLAPFFQKYAAPDFKIDYVIAVTNQLNPSRVTIYGFGKQMGADYSIYDQLSLIHI